MIHESKARKWRGTSMLLADGSWEHDPSGNPISIRPKKRVTENLPETACHIPRIGFIGQWHACASVGTSDPNEQACVKIAIWVSQKVVLNLLQDGITLMLPMGTVWHAWCNLLLIGGGHAKLQSGFGSF